jgi:uncharacterized protein YkwD
VNENTRAAVVLIIIMMAASLAAAQQSELLELTNLARAQAGAPPLQLSSDLSRAAQAHAELMAQKAQLSHQFSGEPELMQRLAAASHAPFNAVAENLALAADVPSAHDTLMHSPPHRENLLNPEYNLVGFGLVQKGTRLYVVEDFAHQTTKESSGTAAQSIAQAVAGLRREAGKPELQPSDSSAEQQSACAMAQQDTLKAPAPKAGYSIRYTAFDPAELPASVRQSALQDDFHSFAVGVCFARAPDYPAGAYWVVISFQ